MVVAITGGPDHNLHVKIPYDRRVIPVIRRVPDRSWDPQIKAWVLPDTQFHADALLEELLQSGLFTRDPGVQTTERRPADEIDRIVHDRIAALHYSTRTERSYVQWIHRFRAFHAGKALEQVTEAEINTFLTHLAVKEKVSASTQNQALSALLFLYRHVFGRDVGDLGTVIRANKPVRLPTVLTRREVKMILDALPADHRLMATLLYGAGLRLMECLQLRVQDIDFEKNEIHVHNGKGAKDRKTMLPTAVKGVLQEHLLRVRSIHKQDIADGWGAVALPDALDRKFPGAAKEWRWQWVFPQKNRWKNQTTG